MSIKSNILIFTGFCVGMYLGYMLHTMMKVNSFIDNSIQNTQIKNTTNFGMYFHTNLPVIPISHQDSIRLLAIDCVMNVINYNNTKVVDVDKTILFKLTVALFYISDKAIPDSVSQWSDDYLYMITTIRTIMNQYNSGSYKPVDNNLIQLLDKINSTVDDNLLRRL